MPKISELPAAASLTGAELVPLVQAGATVQTTVEALASLGGAGEVMVASGTMQLADAVVKTNAFTVPTGKYFIPTKCVFANPRPESYDYGTTSQLRIWDATGLVAVASVVSEETSGSNDVIIAYVNKFGQSFGAGQTVKLGPLSGHDSDPLEVCDYYLFGILVDI